MNIGSAITTGDLYIVIVFFIVAQNPFAELAEWTAGIIFECARAERLNC